MTVNQWNMLNAAVKAIKSARRDLQANPRATMRRVMREIDSEHLRYTGIAGFVYMACVIVAWSDAGRPDDVLP